MTTIRVNRKLLQAHPEIFINELWALFSYKGDRLRYTSIKNVGAKDALDEIEMHGKRLTWFGSVDAPPSSATVVMHCTNCNVATDHRKGICIKCK